MKKARIVIFLIAIIAVFGFCLSDVFATETPTTCGKGAELSELTEYYGVSYSWSENTAVTNTSGKHPRNILVIKSKRGKFRILSMEYDGTNMNGLFSDNDKPSKGATDTFYKMGNDDFVIDSNGKQLTINAAGQQGNTLTMKVALSSKSSPCDDYETAKKDSTGEFTADLEIIIPNVNVLGSSVGNTNYDGLCKLVRGEAYTGSTEGITMNQYLTDADSINFYKNVVKYCTKTTVESNYDNANLKKLINNAIETRYVIVQMNASNNVTESDWSIKFEETKNKALAAGNEFEFAGSNDVYKITNGNKTKVNFNDSVFSMNCKYESNNVSDLLVYDSNNKYNIKANSRYYYGHMTTTEKATFIWDHNPNSESQNVETKYTGMKTTEETLDVCTRKCEEVVEVDYGPPVASRAGLCFEYQVQVTSRVKCTADIKFDELKEPKVCNPVPVCNNVSTSHSAGPTEDFEKCINKCDGGKYTKKCSDKCFKSTYGKKSTSGFLGLFSNKTVTYYNYGLIRIKDVKPGEYQSEFPGYSGFYYYNTAHDVLWWESTGGKQTYARYFFENERVNTEYTHGGLLYNFQPEDGFRKKIYSNGFTNYLCDAPCRYLDCDRDEYVNAADRDRDYAKNSGILKTAINKCRAAASCSTNLSTFTINVSYDRIKNQETKEKESITITYPYSTKEQNLQSLGNEGAAESSITGAENIIKKRGGCYSKDRTNNVEYYTRWGFAGTWENPKTGEISYTEHSGWDKNVGKFCLPKNALNVNANYWKYYHNKVNTKIEDLCNIDADETCAQLRDEVAAQTSVGNISKWNINAKTTKFGYFGWTFNIHCFYGIYKPGFGGDEPEFNYKIRSVDLSNLFPSEDANEPRDPGFNWSEYANSVKNLNYGSLPSLYAKMVQESSSKLYEGEEYLDYSFFITRDQMREMRNKMKDVKKDYTNYSGKISKVNGINVYESDLFRGGSAILSTNIKPSVTALACNNIKNYKENDCTIYSAE